MQKRAWLVIMYKLLHCCCKHVLTKRLRCGSELRRWTAHRKQYTSAWPGSFSARLVSLLERRGSGDNHEGEGLDCSQVPSVRAAMLQSITALGSGEGEEGMANVAPESIANAFRTCYQELRDDAKKRRVFLLVLAGSLGVDHSKVADGARHFLEQHSSDRSEATLLKSESSVRQALTPFYCHLFATIGRLEGGIGFLVELRGDILSVIGESAGGSHLLSEMSSHLRETLAQWFTPQLLKVQQVTWESPCDILEKVSEYEAVHRLRHWKDLKHRLGPNRRCFIFTHQALPREPLVILHVALTSQPSSSIQALLSRSLSEQSEAVSTAVFYSISSTQKGLSGVSLGDFLIRDVVQKLQQEWAGQLRTFVTLSPIPGFRKWLLSHLQQGESGECHVSRGELENLMQLFPHYNSPLEALKEALTSTPWATQPEGEVAAALRQPMASLCAKYLALEKRRGRALDPVANFHLTNGASIFRINWLGDSTPKGLHRSFGFMVNYLYEMSCVARNSEAYRASGRLEVAEDLQQLLL